MLLVMAERTLNDILAHAREGRPLEVCGILAGARDGDRREIARHYRVRNAHERPVGEYLIDPKELLRVTLEIEDELGLDVLGFYHSHPAGPPRLSATDAARATWPDAAYFLVWLHPAEGYGAWTWDAPAGRFRDIPVEVVVAAPSRVPSFEELRRLGPFLIDPAHARVHRSESLSDACAAEIDPSRVQAAADILRASLTLKTRHYLPCPRCWPGTAKEEGGRA